MQDQIPDDVRARFWKKVNVDGPDECWLWTGMKTSKGYGKLKIELRPTLAHRISLSIATSVPITDPRHVLHSCDNPTCVNPNHLRWGSHTENMNDAIERDRFNRWNGSRRGTKNPKAKLSQSDVDFIRASATSGRTRTSLAIQFSVDRRTIYDVVTGRTWQ